MEAAKVQDPQTKKKRNLFRYFLNKAAFKIPGFWKIRNLLLYGKVNINTKKRMDAYWADKDVHTLEGHYDNLFEAIRERIGYGDRILDLGCGNGLLLHKLQQSDLELRRLAGVDLADTAIETVQALGLEGKVSKLPEIPYGPEEFDVVISTETLEHLTNPDRTMRSIQGLKAKKLLLSVPNFLPPMVEHAHMNGWTNESFRAFLVRTLPDYRIKDYIVAKEVEDEMDPRGHILAELVRADIATRGLREEDKGDVRIKARKVDGRKVVG